MEHTLRQVFHLPNAIGNLAPEEHTDLLLIVGASQHIHNLFGILTATAIGLDVCLTMPLVAVVVSLGSCQLDATEGATLDIRLYLQNPRDKLGIGGTETDTPTWHIVRFRHGIELDATIFGSWDLQDGEMLLVENEGIRIVVDHDQIVVHSEAHQSLVGLTTGIAARRHIGIVGPHEFDTREVHLLQLVEIGLPTVVFTEVIIHNLGTQNLRERRVCRISRIRHQHLVARIDKGKGDVQDALLGTYQGQELALGIQIDIIPTLIETSHRLAQLGGSHGGLIAVSTGLMSHLT